MSLRKSPTRSPALLAANRANARNSTGPRTARGKAQVTLNALKQGGYAGRLFRSNLLRAREDVAWTTGCTVRSVTPSAPWESPSGCRPSR